MKEKRRRQRERNTERERERERERVNIQPYQVTKERIEKKRKEQNGSKKRNKKDLHFKGFA